MRTDLAGNTNYFDGPRLGWPCDHGNTMILLAVFISKLVQCRTQMSENEHFALSIEDIKPLICNLLQKRHVL